MFIFIAKTNSIQVTQTEYDEASCNLGYVCPSSRNQACFANLYFANVKPNPTETSNNETMRLRERDECCVLC